MISTGSLSITTRGRSQALNNHLGVSSTNTEETIFTYSFIYLFIFLYNLLGNKLRLLSVYEFNTVFFFLSFFFTTSTNGQLQKCLFLLACVQVIPTLVCAWVMREKSGACCISIKPSKTMGIYGDGLWPQGERVDSCFCMSKRKRVQTTAGIKHFQAFFFP